MSKHTNKMYVISGYCLRKIKQPLMVIWMFFIGCVCKFHLNQCSRLLSPLSNKWAWYKFLFTWLQLYKLFTWTTIKKQIFSGKLYTSVNQYTSVTWRSMHSIQHKNEILKSNWTIIPTSFIIQQKIKDNGNSLYFPLAHLKFVFVENAVKFKFSNHHYCGLDKGVSRWGKGFLIF